jgi:hypothetical protein
MKILLGKPGNFTRRHIVHTINRQEVPLRVAVNLFILWGVVLSTGCQANPVETSISLESTPSPAAESLSTSFPVAPTQGNNQMTPSQHIPADAALQEFIDKAIADLAQRLSIPVTQITFLESTSVVWPDASLGCPQPGIVYTQELTSGFLIHLEAGGKVYEYHADSNEQVILCRATQTFISPVKPGDIQDGQPWMPP